MVSKKISIAVVVCLVIFGVLSIIAVSENGKNSKDQSFQEMWDAIQELIETDEVLQAQIDNIGGNMAIPGNVGRNIAISGNVQG